MGYLEDLFINEVKGSLNKGGGVFDPFVVELKYREYEDENGEWIEEPYTDIPIEEIDKARSDGRPIFLKDGRVWYYFGDRVIKSNTDNYWYSFHLPTANFVPNEETGTLENGSLSCSTYMIDRYGKVLWENVLVTP